MRITIRFYIYVEGNKFSNGCLFLGAKHAKPTMYTTHLTAIFIERKETYMQTFDILITASSREIHISSSLLRIRVSLAHSLTRSLDCTVLFLFFFFFTFSLRLAGFRFEQIRRKIVFKKTA